MKTNKVKSFAKINLALYVTGKLTRLHKIESVVKFIELHDTISIKKINSDKHKISFNGNFSKNIKKENTVIRMKKKLRYFTLNRDIYNYIELILNIFSTTEMESFLAKKTTLSSF